MPPLGKYVLEYWSVRSPAPTLSKRIGRGIGTSAFVLLAISALAAGCLDAGIPLPPDYFLLVSSVAGFAGILCSLAGFLLGAHWSILALPACILVAMVTPTY